MLDDSGVDVVLERVLESARVATGAQYAALGVLDESRTGLARFLTLGIDEAARREIGVLPRGRGVLRVLITDPVPLRLAEVGSRAPTRSRPATRRCGRSWGVPVLVAGEPYGNLYLTDKQDGAEFTEDDEQTVVLLAEFAGVAIDRAQLFRRLWIAPRRTAGVPGAARPNADRRLRRRAGALVVMDLLPGQRGSERVPGLPVQVAPGRGGPSGPARPHGARDDSTIP